MQKLVLMVAALGLVASPAFGQYLWDNGDTACTNLLACQIGPTFDAAVIDDFILSGTGVIDVLDVHWTGGYWNGSPIPMDFRVSFFDSDPAGAPNPPPAIYSADFAFADVNETVSPLCATHYDYYVDLPAAFEATAGEKYWLGVQALSDPFPQWGWASVNGTQLSPCYFGSDYFGFPFWTPGATVFGVDYDVSFKITPEPTSLALLGLGGLALLRRRR